MVDIPAIRQRCQLIFTFDVTRDISDNKLIDLIKTQNIAACILYDKEGNESRLQQRASGLVIPIQAQGLAMMVAGDSRIAVRVNADGVHSEEGAQIALERFPKNRKMLGYGNIKDRHSAMELGEAGADYIMFGKLGADKQPQSHPRNLRLAAWWAQVMEVPCIVQAGTDIKTIKDAVETGAEFIAVEEMIFSSDDGHATLTKLHQFLNIMPTHKPS